MTKELTATTPDVCEVCGTDLAPSGRGRPPRYCSQACRARAYRQRTLGRAPDTGVDARRRPRVAGNPSPVGAATIGRTAIDIADESGINAVSMRSVATALDVSVMSLYRHVSDRRDLDDLMVDLIYGDHPLPDPGGEDWRADLESSARAEWSIYCEHPWVTHLVASTTRPPRAPNLMAVTDWRLRALAGVGLDFTEMVQVTIMFGTYMTSAGISLAIEAEELRTSGVTRSEWLGSQRDWFDRSAASGAVRLPMVEKFGDEAMAASDPTNIFEFGLHRILDGTAVLIESATRR